MSEETEKLALPFLIENQARKHITHNEALARLDLLVHCAAVSRTIAAEPSASDGDLYILPAGKTGGSWADMDDLSLAGLINGAWAEFTPRPGWTVFVEDEGLAVVFTGAAWRALADERVAKAGDAMTGALTLPVNGIQVGASQLSTANGRVGVVKTQPSYPLHVGRNQRDMVGVGPAYNGGVAVDPGDVRVIVSAWTGRPEMQLSRHNVGSALLGLESTGALTFEMSGNARIVLEGNGNLRPAASGTQPSGSASYPWSAVYAQSGVITTSDARDKTDIGACPLGLDFILALQPRAFRFSATGDTAGEARPGQRLHTGLIAQEVRAALPGGLDWAGWTLGDADDPESRQGLRYEGLIAPLIAAIQTLASRIEVLEAA